ncbi:MAG: RNA polymerase sigma factor [Longimicrobiales bacterium]
MTSQTFDDEMLAQLPAVLRYARFLTGNATDAEDLVQETFLRAFRARDSYAVGSNARAWLFTIARNTHFKAHRKASRSTALEDTLDADTLDVTPFHTAPADSIDRIFSARELGPALNDAIDALPAAHREVIALVDLDGLGYADAAETIGVPIGTVRSRLFRARRTLQQRLIEYARDAGIGVAAAKSEEP